jgi:hypothetical protein
LQTIVFNKLDLNLAAMALNNTLEGLVKRLKKVGLGYLINQQMT